MNEIYAQHTGQKLETVVEAMERDRFMVPEEAKDFGLIDAVVTRHDLPGSDENGGASGKNGD